MNAAHRKTAAAPPPADAPAPGSPAQTAGAAAWDALTRPGRISGMIVTTLPAVAFVAVDGLSSLYPALAAAGGAAMAGFAWRLRRRQPLRQALAGLLIVAACASVAAITGQERGFFLIPALIPFAVIAVCVVSIATRRPLTGVLLNRVSGGPAGWREIDRLRRVYTITTLVAATVNVINAAVQAVFYLGNAPVVLATAHIATGPVFAVIVAVTIVLARRAMPGKLADPRDMNRPGSPVPGRPASHGTPLR
ncbi:MAG: DUF3159 domain-containing protein [Trebonia sp.]